MSEATPFPTDLELVIVADCECGGERHGGECRRARAVLAERNVDLAAMRKRIRLANERLRELPDRELESTLFDRDAFDSGLWRLALRECERREAERGYPLRCKSRAAWNAENRERIAKGLGSWPEWEPPDNDGEPEHQP